MTHVSRFTLFVFVAALLPRLYALGTFLTIDEVKWAEGAAQFLLALHSGDLARTYWHFFPGILITWGNALALGATCLSAADLDQCANSHVANLPEFIGWLRLTPVLFATFGITGVYLLGRKLIGEKIVLLAALLLAFDPFFIAHSRILNGDSTAAILMFLSLLSFLFYWLKVSSRDNFQPSSFRPQPFLLLSGVLAGLALLTKLPAPLIGLFIGGLGLVALARDWPQHGWVAVRHWLGAVATWGLVALLVFGLLWPALWIAPIATLRQMYFDSFEVGGVGEGHDAFFLGQTLDDPGPWFYAYAIAFRLTPVVLVGLLIALGWLLTRFRPRREASPRQMPARFTPQNAELLLSWVLLAFVIFIIGLANVSPKKLDRYVMAVIPPLLFLAAIGLAKIEQLLKFPPAPTCPPNRGMLLRSPVVSFVLLAGLAAFHLASALLAAPYYLTYYNPLLGGPQQAAAQVPVGWGEGMEQAAYYLNNLPNAQSLSVSAWYGDMFQPYFVGQRASFADDGRAQLAADYVVFYINQIQRQKPHLGLINYFRANQPVFVVKIGPFGQVTNGPGTNWVEVYQAPAAQSASGAPKIEGVAQLLAYKVAEGRGAGQPAPLSAGEAVPVALFFRVLGPLPEQASFEVALVSRDSTLNQPWGVWHANPIRGDWLEGAVIELPGTLALPADLPPGDYRLLVTLQAADGSTLAEFAISDKDPAIVVK